MILLVRQIKEEEALLDDMLSQYEAFVVQDDRAQYDSLLEDYAAFKHALVHLVCASAGHKTQDAYAYAYAPRPWRPGPTSPGCMSSLWWWASRRPSSASSWC